MGLVRHDMRQGFDSGSNSTLTQGWALIASGNKQERDWLPSYRQGAWTDARPVLIIREKEASGCARPDPQAIGKARAVLPPRVAHTRIMMSPAASSHVLAPRSSPSLPPSPSLPSDPDPPARTSGLSHGQPSTLTAAQMQASQLLDGLCWLVFAWVRRWLRCAAPIHRWQQAPRRSDSLAQSGSERFPAPIHWCAHHARVLQAGVLFAAARKAAAARTRERCSSAICTQQR